MKILTFHFLLLLCLFCSCEQELSNTIEPKFEVDVLDELEFSVTPYPNYKFQKEELVKLAAYGFSRSRVLAVKKNTRSGESIAYQIDEDILLDKEEVLNFIPNKENIDVAGDKHFRTRNIVGSSVREILIVGVFPRGDFGTGGRAETLREGIELAAEAYDDLDLRISFRGFSVSSASRSAVHLMSQPNTIMVWFSDDLIGTIAAGEGTFPTSDGLPGKVIRINPSQATRTAEQNARLLVHEIGHNIGFRHTDFFNRELSCFGLFPDIPSNEGQSESGAIQIPGTPGLNYMPFVDGFSVFNSCPASVSPDYFFPLDIVALESLYPVRLPTTVTIFDLTEDCEGQACPCGEGCRCLNGECVSL
jgi:hypothetical protein